MIERNSWERIRRQIKRLESTAARTDAGLRPHPLPPPKSTAIGRASGAIGALSGTVPGTGNAVVYWATTLSSLVTSGSTEAVLNLGGEIADQTFFALKREHGTGKWFADSAQAPPSPTSPSASNSAEYFPAYALRNNTDQGAISASSEVTVTFDTQIHRYPDDTTVFTVSSLAEISIKQTGMYTFAPKVGIQPVAAAAYGVVWVEEDAVEIPGASLPWMSRVNSTEGVGVAFSFDHVITSSTKLYRVRFVGSAACSIFGSTKSGDTGGYSRLDIRKVRNLSS